VTLFTLIRFFFFFFKSTSLISFFSFSAVFKIILFGFNRKLNNVCVYVYKYVCMYVCMYMI
jgi:hypothetical protein